MFYGQINAPATLPIYVLMHLVNSKFLRRLLYTSSRRLFFFNAIQRSLFFDSEEHDTAGQSKITLWSLIHTAKHTFTWCIQGVSQLVDITAGCDFLGLCEQESSYKHVSNFGWLWSYGHFLIPIHALVWTALWNQLAGDVLNLLAYRLRCNQYFCQLIAALSIEIAYWSSIQPLSRQKTQTFMARRPSSVATPVNHRWKLPASWTSLTSALLITLSILSRL